MDQNQGVQLSEPEPLPAGNETECVICRENISDDSLTELRPCNHRYHSTCFQQWTSNNASRSCAYCRGDIQSVATGYANGEYANVEEMVFRPRPIFLELFQQRIAAGVFLFNSSTGYKIVTSDDLETVFVLRNGDGSETPVVAGSSITLQSLTFNSVLVPEPNGDPEIPLAEPLEAVNLWRDVFNEPGVRTWLDVVKRYTIEWQRRHPNRSTQRRTRRQLIAQLAGAEGHQDSEVVTLRPLGRSNRRRIEQAQLSATRRRRSTRLSNVSAPRTSRRQTIQSSNSQATNQINGRRIRIRNGRSRRVSQFGQRSVARRNARTGANR